MSSAVFYQGSNLLEQGITLIVKEYKQVHITNSKLFQDKLFFIIQNYQSRLSSHKILLIKSSITSLDHAFTNWTASKVEYKV